MSVSERAVVVVATFCPCEGALPGLQNVLTGLAPEIHEEDGCELYAIHSVEDKTLVMIEKWASQAALDAHATGDCVRRMRVSVAPLVIEPAQVLTMHAIPSGILGKGVL